MHKVYVTIPMLQSGWDNGAKVRARWGGSIELKRVSRAHVLCLPHVENSVAYYMSTSKPAYIVSGYRKVKPCASPPVLLFWLC